MLHAVHIDEQFQLERVTAQLQREAARVAAARARLVERLLRLERLSQAVLDVGVPPELRHGFRMLLVERARHTVRLARYLALEAMLADMWEEEVA